MSYASVVRGGIATIAVPTMPAAVSTKSFAEILREHMTIACPCCHIAECEFVMVASEPASPFELVSSDAESAASADACCAGSEATCVVAVPAVESSDDVEVAHPGMAAMPADGMDDVSVDSESEGETAYMYDTDTREEHLAEVLEAGLYNAKRGGACARSTRWSR